MSVILDKMVVGFCCCCCFVVVGGVFFFGGGNFKRPLKIKNKNNNYIHFLLNYQNR